MKIVVLAGASKSSKWCFFITFPSALFTISFSTFIMFSHVLTYSFSQIFLAAACFCIWAEILRSQGFISFCSSAKPFIAAWRIVGPSLPTECPQHETRPTTRETILRASFCVLKEALLDVPKALPIMLASKSFQGSWRQHSSQTFRFHFGATHFLCLQLHVSQVFFTFAFQVSLQCKLVG